MYFAEMLSICNRLLRFDKNIYFGIFETAARCLYVCVHLHICVYLHLNRFKYTHKYIGNKVRLLTFALDTEQRTKREEEKKAK